MASLPWYLQTPGTVFKLTDRGVGMNVLGDPATDQQAMKATAIICTAAVDRQNEIILPDGGDYTDYALNPTVLWGHGLNPLFPLPIAKCEDPNGQLALRPSSGQIEADSYFSSKDRTSEQIFSLIVDKIIRATSIHVLHSVKAVQQIEGRPVTVYPKWSMLEFSWGAIGVNAEAVRKTLDLGKLAGSEICESIAKTLQPFAAVRKGNGIGCEFNQEKPKAMTTDPNATPPAAAAESDPVPAEQAETQQEQMKPSAALMAAIGQSLSELQANIAAGTQMIENPEVLEFLDKEFNSALGDLISMVAGKSPAKALPEGEGEGEEREPAKPDEEAVKTWLASGQGRSSIFTGYAAQLESLAKSPKLAGPQKQLVTRIAQSVRRAVADSRGVAKTLKDTEKAAKDADATARETALAAQIEGVAKTFESLSGGLKKLVPVA
jgi:hypothetical protein